MKLVRYGRQVASVFDLLGRSENDMSSALGYALSRSRTFLGAFVELCGGATPSHLDDARILLQTGHGRGITDLEIAVGKEFFALIEAKRGTDLPTVAQLARYAPTAVAHPARRRTLVTLTHAPPQAASARRYPKMIEGVPVVHLTWRRVRELARVSRSVERGLGAKRLLTDLITYLETILGMETTYSNRVFVVALARGNPPGWGISWRDIVRERRRYFYQVVGRWPDPPNYMGFRYDGRLQSIHKVEEFTVLTNPRDAFPEAPDVPWPDNYLLTLGPPILPPKVTPTGPGILQARQVWCMLDLLLTSGTIREAELATKRREREGSPRAVAPSCRPAPHGEA